MQVTLQRNDARQVRDSVLTVNLELDVASHVHLLDVEQRLHAIRRNALLGRRGRERRLD